MTKKYEPLTESYYYILLCLYKGPNHGYGIMQDAMKFSNNRVKIGSGTMYTAVSKMIKKGWIRDSITVDDSDDRRRTYEITKEGIDILYGEIKRLKELLNSAKLIEDNI
ncbi:PadR family transcriptional regulator [Terrisporobacter glycolicus]|uniref:Transcription regulator PadR N-terminal domain-containing protein n=1 Tax=Terrisporobacter glycolicus ATCC 14880 = DSM 1288 TaxID=1121315 RepID=A0ABZ2EZA8_9FIRM|nr:helix-turn-helix transcriptional regulator [Terrisporobacter glycolicus]